MFTCIWSFRVSCKFQACRGELVKYQTCLIFLRPLPTPVSNCNLPPSNRLVGLLYGLSVTFPCLSVNETGLSVTSIRLVPNMDFQTVCDDSQTVQEVLQYSW